MELLMSAWASTAERLGTGDIILVLATVLAMSCAYWILDVQKGRKEKGLLVPPGAVGLPYFIWDTFGFLKSHHRNELKLFFDQKVAKYGPIFKLSIMGDTVVVLDPPAGNKFLFGSEYKLFRKAYPKSMSDVNMTNSILTLEEKLHNRFRSQLVGKFLGPESMHRYVGRMERNVLQHLEEHWLGKDETGEEICTQNMMSKFAFGFVVELWFGLTDKTKMETLSNAFQIWSAGLLSCPINLPGFKFHRALRAKAVLFEIVSELMASRRQELKEGTAAPDQDLMSVLLTQADDGGMNWTDEIIRDNLILLLYGGHGTTAASLTLTISDIAKHPEVYEKVIQEHALIAARKKEGELLTTEDLRGMTYTWQVVQETMRHTPILAVGFRQATKDFVYNGYTIRKGWKIFWTQDRTTRDPAFFENPDSYEPSRFSPSVRPGPHVFFPFGAGSRVCPGKEFAKMEILVFLHHFLKRFKWSLVDPGEKVIRPFLPRTKKGSPIRITRSQAF